MGFLADMQREFERERLRQDREQRVAIRAQEKLARDQARDAARLEKELKRLHADERAAEVDRMNAKVEAEVKSLTGLLESTLGVDDHIDLDDLKTAFALRPFQGGKLAKPETQPAYVAPNPPRGINSLVP